MKKIKKPLTEVQQLLLRREEIRKVSALSGKDGVFDTVGIDKQIKRARKKEKFVKELLPLLKEKYTVIEGDNVYAIDAVRDQFLYYPKSDSLQCMNTGDWNKEGKSYINTELL